MCRTQSGILGQTNKYWKPKYYKKKWAPNELGAKSRKYRGVWNISMIIDFEHKEKVDDPNNFI